jgi:NADH:ubiquinone oxidoreductase subunit B-like Fe-S oxidoreductase
MDTSQTGVKRIAGSERGTALRSRTPRAIEFLRQGGDSFQTSKVDAVLNWSRKYSMFLYPFVTACCGMEFMSVAGPRYDLTAPV